MQRSSLTRFAVLAVLVAGLACARNKSSDDDFAAARDTSAAAMTDSAKRNQTETGMTDSTGRSTLGTEAEKTPSSSIDPPDECQVRRRSCALPRGLRRSPRKRMG